MGIEFDFMRLLRAIKNNWLFLLAVAAIFGASANIYANYAVVPQYSSTAMFYVEVKNNEQSSLTSSDITAAQQLAQTCKAILSGNIFMNEVNEDLADENLTASAISKMISISSVNSTECFRVSVTTSDPHLSSKIAHSVVENAPQLYSKIVKSGTLRIIDSESYNDVPVYPSIATFTVIGTLIGLVFSCAIVFILEIADNKVKDDEDLFRMYNIPVFVEVTDFESLERNSKGKAYGHYADYAKAAKDNLDEFE